MQLSIRYLTRYTYGVQVGESQNALRACPADTESQRLLSYQLTVDPPANVLSYTDYWGTRVDVFGINHLHTRLTLVADANVETSNPRQPQEDGQVQDFAGDDYEFLAASRHVGWDGELADWAQSLIDGDHDPVKRAIAVHEGVSDHMSYDPRATVVGTPVAAVFRDPRGVCQDYAHLSLAAFRSIGMAARYVSGYFYATPEGTQPSDDEIRVETHAWVEVAIPGFGWWGMDPTNRQVTGERHVKIGHGRDYEDVTPLRGSYHGGGEDTELDVGVLMSRSDLASHVMEPQPRAAQQQQQQQ